MGATRQPSRAVTITASVLIIGFVFTVYLRNTIESGSLRTSTSLPQLSSAPVERPTDDPVAGSHSEDGSVTGVTVLPKLRSKQSAANFLLDHGHSEGDAPALSTAQPRVLILTPVKNAMKHLPRYFEHLRELSFSHAHISLGLMDSDSDDKPTSAQLQRVRNAAADGAFSDSSAELLRQIDAVSSNGVVGGDDDTSAAVTLSGTLCAMLAEAPLLQAEFASVTVFQHNFGLELGGRDRHAANFQLERRKMLARSRNHLLITALKDEDWVLWLDSDLESFPPDIIQQLLSSGKQIVVPNCVMSPGGRSYDLNSWRAAGTALGNAASVEEVTKAHDSQHVHHVEAGNAHKLELEGYGPSGHLYLDKLRREGDVVRLDAVGGAMLLVDAELHRHGLMFPPFVYRHRIETEGLSMMALDMGVLSWGMPNVEVIHK